MPGGMESRQKLMGVPKTRYSTPEPLRCAARDRPYGPAPIIATSMSSTDHNSDSESRKGYPERIHEAWTECPTVAFHTMPMP